MGLSSLFVWEQSYTFILALYSLNSPNIEKSTTSYGTQLERRNGYTALFARQDKEESMNGVMRALSKQFTAKK